jgi:hypothetical protein
VAGCKGFSVLNSLFRSTFLIWFGSYRGLFLAPFDARAAEFRKALVEGGIPEEEAMDMTRQYLATLTRWTDMVMGARIGSFNQNSDEE